MPIWRSVWDFIPDYTEHSTFFWNQSQWCFYMGQPFYGPQQMVRASEVTKCFSHMICFGFGVSPPKKLSLVRQKLPTTPAVVRQVKCTLYGHVNTWQTFLTTEQQLIFPVFSVVLKMISILPPKISCQHIYWSLHIQFTIKALAFIMSYRVWSAMSVK